MRTVLNLIELYMRQINVGLNPNATDGNQLALGDGFLDGHSVRRVLEERQDGLSVRPIGCRTQAEDEFGAQIPQNPFVGVGRSVVGLINYYIVEALGGELRKRLG